MAALRIYADYNGVGRSEGGPFVIPLDTLGSLRDLTNAGVRLRNGVVLAVVDASDEEEDLEAEAAAEYDVANRVWLAVLGAEGYRYVPKGDRTPDRRFLCLGCRRDLGAAPTGDGYGCPRVERCPDCATPITAALAPPDGAGDHPEAAT